MLCCEKTWWLECTKNVDSCKWIGNAITLLLYVAQHTRHIFLKLLSFHTHRFTGICTRIRTLDVSTVRTHLELLSTLLCLQRVCVKMHFMVSKWKRCWDPLSVVVYTVVQYSKSGVWLSKEHFTLLEFPLFVKSSLFSPCNFALNPTSLVQMHFIFH